MTTFLIGADPEVFVRNPNSGKFISAHGMIQGTKTEPFKVDKGALQVDGMALEFNIDPASNLEEFVLNIKTVVKTLKETMPSGYEMVADPIANFDEEYFRDEVPAEAKELGCEPDYNAYTGDVNPRPEGERPFRTASGHVHIGWTKDMDPYNPTHFGDCRAVAKQLDVYLGLPSLSWDRDNTRRSLYGMPGAFRPKPYGMEYRVLSNAWLRREATIRYVYDAALMGVTDLLNGNDAEARVSSYSINYAKTLIERGLWDHASQLFSSGYMPVGLARPPRQQRPKKEAA